MTTVYIGAGIALGPGVSVGGDIPNNPLTSANIWYNMQTNISGASDGTSISSLTNSGVDGTTYAATNVPGHVAPTVATVGGAKVLLINGYGLNQWGYNIANSFTVGTGSLFMVGWDAFGTDYNYQSRVMGFGGQYGSPYQVCFFGWSYLNNASFLFRDTGDGGLSLSSYSSAGLQVFGIVKTGSTIKYYDNTTTPVSSSVGFGTFGFNTVGYRAYGINQPSTGYLGDVAWFNSALSDSDAGNVISYLKNTYNIA